MANEFINPTVVAKECISQLKNNCVMGNLVYRGFEEEYKVPHRGWKPGAKITLKAPVYFRTHTDRDITSSTVDLREQATVTGQYSQTDFYVSSWAGVAFKVNATEMTQDIDIFARRFITPAMEAIADHIDRQLLGLYTDVCNQVGTPNSASQSLRPYLRAHAVLTDQAVPLRGRSCVINTEAKIYLADAVGGLFNQPIAQTAVERAQFGDIAGFTMYESQNVRTHTPGSVAGLDYTAGFDNIEVHGDVEDLDTGMFVDQNGVWDPPLPGITLGDIFTVSSLDASTVNACNPTSGQDLGYNRQFAVVGYTTNLTAPIELLTNPGSIPFPIRSSASTADQLPYQNMTNLPRDTDQVIIAGTPPTADTYGVGIPYDVNLAFHRDALGLIMLPIEMPLSINWKAVMNQDGYTISVARYFDGDTFEETIRFDALYGVKVLNPFMACRIAV